MSEICAGVVTFQPEIVRLSQNLGSLTTQVDTVFVVDNHSTNLNEIRQLVLSFSNVVLVANNHNYGIAKALNQMCERADAQGYEWILTLDQDTVIPLGMVSVFQKYMVDANVGIICPAVYYEGWDRKVGSKKETEYVDACMTSASLTRIKAWSAIGGFREDYFIDYVDNEFCMRLRLAQYKILRINSCQISHQLGETGVKSFLGIKVKYSKHSPIRLYYMARNNYLFIRDYSNHLPVMKEWAKLVYVLTQGVFFSDRKKDALRFVRRGLIDGRKQLTGEYKNSKED